MDSDTTLGWHGHAAQSDLVSACVPSPEQVVADLGRPVRSNRTVRIADAVALGDAFVDAPGDLRSSGAWLEPYEGLVVVRCDRESWVLRRVIKPRRLCVGDVLVAGGQALRMATASGGQAALEVAAGRGTIACRIGDGLSIGRERGDLCFPDDVWLSALHCRVDPRGEEHVVRDLDSLNGTFVQIGDGEVIRCVTELRIGSATIHVGPGLGGWHARLAS